MPGSDRCLSKISSWSLDKPVGYQRYKRGRAQGDRVDKLNNGTPPSRQGFLRSVHIILILDIFSYDLCLVIVY